MHLPTELLERVIDYLHDDSSTLATCCLVSQAFVVPSRYHLWGHLKITHDTLNEGRLLRDPSKASGFPAFQLVRNLEMDMRNQVDNQSPITEYISIFELFTAVRNLQLLHMDGFKMPDPIKDRFFRAFPTVTSLILTHVIFVDNSQFADLLSNMPQLRSLALNDVAAWGLNLKDTPLAITTDFQDAWFFSNPLLLPSNIEELTMQLDMRTTWTRQSLVAQVQTDTVKNLRLINIYPPENINLLSPLLQTIGPQLEELILNYLPDIQHEGSHNMINLTHTTNLRRVTFQDTNGERRVSSWMVDLLHQINSTSLEAVTMELAERTIQGIEWHGLDRAMSWLTPARFPKLRVVCVRAWESDLEGPIRQYLRDWDNMGILEFECLTKLGKYDS